MSQIDDEWLALQQILGRQSKIVQDQSDALRAKIQAEDQVVHQKIMDISSQWSAEKPVSGNMAPNKAEEILQTFESRLSKLRDEAEGVSKAKEALDLPPSPENALSALLEEVQDFRSVWASLNTIWVSLNELREQQWTSVVPRKVKRKLEELVKMMKEMPSRMRQYAAFTHMQDKIRADHAQNKSAPCWLICEPMPCATDTGPRSSRPLIPRRGTPCLSRWGMSGI